MAGNNPAHKRARISPRAKRLTANAELIDDALVARLVGALEVIEQLAALRDHLEKAAPRVIVLHVCLEVIGQSVDPFGQDRHLNFGRTGVARLGGIRLDDFGLAAGSERHRQ